MNQKNIPVGSVEKFAQKRPIWSHTWTLMNQKNCIHVMSAEKCSFEKPIWRIIWFITVNTGHFPVNVVQSLSRLHETWNFIRESTQEKDHTVATDATRPLFSQFRCKTTWRRKPHAHQIRHNNWVLLCRDVIINIYRLGPYNFGVFWSNVSSPPFLPCQCLQRETGSELGPSWIVN